MPLSYTEVKNVDLDKLSEAVDEWKKLAGKFNQVETTFNTEVTKGLHNSNWDGDAATSAFTKFGDIRYQIDAAAQEAKSIHALLSEGLNAFQAAKEELSGIIEELAVHVHLSVNRHDGSVYLDSEKVEPEHFSALQKSYQETFRAYRERTRQAIDDASGADSILSWALTSLGTHRLGFNNGAYSGLKNAKENRMRQRNGEKVSLKEISDAQARTELNSAPAAIQFLSLRPLLAGVDQARHESIWQGIQTATGIAPSYLAGKGSEKVEKNWKGGPGAGGRHRKPSLINRGGRLGTKVFSWPAAVGATVIDFAYTPEINSEDKIAKSRVMAPGPPNSKVQ